MSNANYMEELFRGILPDPIEQEMIEKLWQNFPDLETMMNMGDEHMYDVRNQLAWDMAEKHADCEEAQHQLQDEIMDWLGAVFWGDFYKQVLIKDMLLMKVEPEEYEKAWMLAKLEGKA